MKAGALPFSPWRDDAFLEQESLYALWNKLSWFSALEPAAMMRSCRTAGSPAVLAPKEINYALPERWVRYIKDCAVLPSILGQSVEEMVRRIDRATLEEVPSVWASHSLRVCDVCLADGIHLRIHQHLAVESCPLHGQLLRDACKACGTALINGSAKNKAFCCAACGHRLLTGDMIRFGFSTGEKSKIAQICEGASQALRYLECGIYREHVGEPAAGPLSSYLSHLDPRSLLLEAMSRAFVQRPFWLARPCIQVEGVSVASIGHQESSLSRSLTSAVLISPSLMEKGRATATPETASTGQLIQKGKKVLTAHYQQALKRVASSFLRVAGTAHRACQNSPQLITKDSYDLEEFGGFEILDCCPIALAFWLWRMRSGMAFCSMVSHDDPLFYGSDENAVRWNADLCLYAIERSHLHLCIIAADNLTSTWRNTGRTEERAELYLQTLRSWAFGTIDFSPDGFKRLVSGSCGQSLTFVRAEASHVMRHMPCPGLEPYYQSLRRQLRAVPVFNRQTRQIEPWNLEDQWQQHASAQIDHLQPTEYDWIFFSTTTRNRARLRQPDARLARRLLEAMEIDPSECVNRAINVRSARLVPPKW